MTAVTFEELVRLALNPPAPNLDGQCGGCPAGPGQPCGSGCANRFEYAMEAISVRLYDLTRSEFRAVLKDAEEWRLRNGGAPGVGIAWTAVEDEAGERGVHCPSL